MFLGFDWLFPFPCWGIFQLYLFKIFLIHFLFFFWDPCNSNIGAFNIVPEVSETILVLCILFTLVCSSEVISTILSSTSLIHSSASDILVLIPSRVFSISVIVLFVSVCLFFNSSRSLWIYSCIFSILFSRFLIIITIIILNPFSGSLPISSLFIWTSVFLLCSFICVVFFCLCFSWVTAVRVLSLAGSHSPPHLPRMPSNTVLVSGPAVGAAQILIWSYYCMFLPPMSTAIRTSVFPFVGALNVLLYIP